MGSQINPTKTVYLGRFARSLSDDATKTLVQAFISCRLDNCNSTTVSHIWQSDSSPAVGAKRGSAAGKAAVSIAIRLRFDSSEKVGIMAVC